WATGGRPDRGRNLLLRHDRPGILAGQQAAQRQLGNDEPRSRHSRVPEDQRGGRLARCKRRRPRFLLSSRTLEWHSVQGPALGIRRQGVQAATLTLITWFSGV